MKRKVCVSYRKLKAVSKSWFESGKNIEGLIT